VEEFNVSIGQFVANIKGDRNKAMDIILSNELLLMQELNYYLTIHNPFRPIEGFLIDIKTRCKLINPDRLRPGIDDFIDKTFLTDASLIYAPSQIALAAVLHAASKEQENLDTYVTEALFGTAKDKLKVLIEAVRSIRSMVKTIELPHKDRVRFLEKKLEKCRNQEYNPDSQMYVVHQSFGSLSNALYTISDINSE
jgi:cyclin H